MSRPSRRQALLSGLGLTAAAMLAADPEKIRAQSKVTAPDSPRQRGFASRIGRANSLAEIEEVARDVMVPTVYQWTSGGAADEITLHWNREAWQRIRLLPRVMVDVSVLDTRTKLLGQDLPFPILLAPTGGHGLMHPEGEIGTVQGAGASAAIAVISAASTFPVEEIAKNASSPIWAQMFIKPDRGLTRSFVERAEAAGAQALCVTVDDPVTGIRDNIWRAEFNSPDIKLVNRTGITSEKYGPPGAKYTPVSPDKLTWDDVEWLRSFARIPVVLKGILNPDDAERAVRAGVSGIIVSNHGARQLDTVFATMEALPLITERVAGRIPVLVDGGIRRGTDVLKALAMGATAVLIGRPYVYGLAVAGAAGVSRVIDILRGELEVAMALTGRPTISSIDKSVLRHDFRN
jgi:4-hydroxymandelate oxidase